MRSPAFLHWPCQRVWKLASSRRLSPIIYYYSYTLSYPPMHYQRDWTLTASVVVYYRSRLASKSHALSYTHIRAIKDFHDRTIISRRLLFMWMRPLLRAVKETRNFRQFLSTRTTFCAVTSTSVHSLSWRLCLNSLLSWRTFLPAACLLWWSGALSVIHYMYIQFPFPLIWCQI